MATPKPKKIWDNYVELFEVQKSDRIKLVIAGAARDGFKYLNIREFYMRQRDQCWMPGRDGITIPLNYPVEQGARMLKSIDDLIAILPEAREKLEAMTLSDPAHEVWYTPKEKK